MTRSIYLDYQATTPCDPRVLDKMIPYFGQIFGNPHSRNHEYGWQAEEAIEKGRQQVADLIHADPREIIFTSGATESNNLAIKGVMDFYKKDKNHLITCVTEHKCVLDASRHLEQQGIDVTYLPVQANGLIDLAQLESVLRPTTALVSIMAAHNEIGVLQPIKDIGRLCHERGIFFHTDAAQAFGKIPIDVNVDHIDLLSISGHKIYGPKGIGALFVRRKNPRVRLNALINGGGQERGMRSGTLPTPLCVGLGEASVIAGHEMVTEHQRLTYLSQKLLHGIRGKIHEVYLNGDATHRLPGNLNLSFAYVEGEGLMMGIKELAVSSGSACTSSSLEPSYVLKALGLSDDLAHTSIRFGIGRFTTEEEIDHAIVILVAAISRLRGMSPLWEMVQEGVDITQIQWATH